MYKPGIYILLIGMMWGQPMRGQMLPAPLTPPPGNSALLAAIEANDSLTVSRLASTANVNLPGPDGDRPLMYAALYSTPGVMKLLLDRGASPDSVNKLGETALLWSVQDLPKVQLLLAHQANVNTVTHRGNSALLAACGGTNPPEVIRMLLDHGADAKLVNKRGETALTRIAQFGDTATAALLVRAVVDVNRQTNGTESAALFAARCANNTMLSWLMMHGADANQQDQYKATILSYAAIVCDYATVKQVVDSTRNINLTDIDGMTYLMWAAYSEQDRPEIIQLLIDRGADPAFKNEKGQTALSWALSKGNTKTAQLLKAKLKP